MNKSLAIALGVTLAALLAAGVAAWAYNRAHQSDVPLVNKKDVPTPVYDLWVHWQNKYNKKYAAKDQDYRLSVFYDNYKKVKAHMTNSKRTYDMDFNQFMDLTVQEFSKFYLGTKVNANRVRNEVTLDVQRPSTVDWRNTKNVVTPVKNQEQCGSCWAFSTTGGLEGFHGIKTGKFASYSEQQLVDCSGSYGNYGCNGGLMDNAFKYVEAHGITSESDYPYVGYDESCKENSGSYKISAFQDVPQGSSEQLLQAVVNQPVSVAVDAQSWQFYSGGVFSDCGTQLDHGVLLVGYDANDNNIVKNSWGASWGENGYIRLTRGNTCGIANSASYPTA